MNEEGGQVKSEFWRAVGILLVYAALSGIAAAFSYANGDTLEQFKIRELQTFVTVLLFRDMWRNGI